MNFDLMPCLVKDCDLAGQYPVISSLGSTFVCNKHRLALIERLDRDSKWSRADPEE